MLRNINIPIHSIFEVIIHHITPFCSYSIIQHSLTLVLCRSYKALFTGRSECFSVEVTAIIPISERVKLEVHGGDKVYPSAVDELLPWAAGKLRFHFESYPSAVGCTAFYLAYEQILCHIARFDMYGYSEVIWGKEWIVTERCLLWSVGCLSLREFSVCVTPHRSLEIASLSELLCLSAKSISQLLSSKKRQCHRPSVIPS